MESELKDAWQALQGDEPVWQGIAATHQQRQIILARLAAGDPAIALDSLPAAATGFFDAAHVHGAFRSRKIGERDYIVPQRFARMLDFFLSKTIARAEPAQTQEAALQLMLSGVHVLLTGGPGTGKSHVLQRFLGEKAALKNWTRPIRISIAAPTGKAAARFTPAEFNGSTLVECSTIHRVLGIGSDRGKPKYHAQNPIGCDILIVDEISMLDLGMFATLINALSEGAQLILAGDLNQLPAIDGLPINATIELLATTGLMHHAALTAVHRFSPEQAKTYAAISVLGAAAITDSSPGMQILELRGNRELTAFTEQFAKKQFCNAEANSMRSELGKCNISHKDAARTISAALGFIAKQGILTERREGPTGSIAINNRIQEVIAANLSVPTRTLTPIVATVNNYRLNIFNGDAGLLVEWEQNLYAVFVAADKSIRRIPLAHFGGWQVAYALTIHKSQGSEYDDVWVVCDGRKPAADNRLLYTAVTRARNSATVLKIM